MSMSSSSSTSPSMASSSSSAPMSSATAATIEQMLNQGDEASFEEFLRQLHQIPPPIAPPPSPHQSGRKQSGITIGEWTIQAEKQAILNTTLIAAFAKRCEVKLMPEMLFGLNFLKIFHRRSGFVLCFHALDALNRCLRPSQHQHTNGTSNTDGIVYSPFSDEWAQRAAAAAAANPGKVKELETNDDWTFSTTYAGTVINAKSVIRDDSLAIDFAKLRRQDPIRFYDDVILFEDELHDLGVSLLRVKVRVMPERFFVLQRLWMRVDGVVVRVFDTRVVHDFGTNFILRESKFHELFWDKLPPAAAAAAADMEPDKILDILPVKARTMERIVFAT